jgi:hypothetical protein
MTLIIRLRPPARRFDSVRESKLNDTVPPNAAKDSGPVRPYQHHFSNITARVRIVLPPKNFALAPLSNFLQSYWR